MTRDQFDGEPSTTDSPPGDPAMAQRPHNDPDYRAARAWLTANPDTICWHSTCDQPAEDIDHVPAIAEHNHRRGTRCCQLRPACAFHNRSSGAALGNKMREPHTPW